MEFEGLLGKHFIIWGMPPAFLALINYFGDRAWLFAQANLDWDLPIFRLPIIAAMTGVCHCAQVFLLRCGSCELFFARLSWNCNPFDLSLPISSDYRSEHPAGKWFAIVDFKIGFLMFLTSKMLGICSICLCVFCVHFLNLLYWDPIFTFRWVLTYAVFLSLKRDVSALLK
jgi:hypothetical protein